MINNKEIKIIATIGPSSLNKKIILKMDQSGVDIFRINLSHVEINEFEDKMLDGNPKKIEDFIRAFMLSYFDSWEEHVAEFKTVLTQSNMPIENIYLTRCAATSHNPKTDNH